MIPENLNKLTKEEMKLVSGGSPVGFIIYLPKKLEHLGNITNGYLD